MNKRKNVDLIMDLCKYCNLEEQEKHTEWIKCIAVDNAEIHLSRLTCKRADYAKRNRGLR